MTVVMNAIVTVVMNSIVSLSLVVLLLRGGVSGRGCGVVNPIPVA